MSGKKGSVRAITMCGALSDGIFPRPSRKTSHKILLPRKDDVSKITFARPHIKNSILQNFRYSEKTRRKVEGTNNLINIS